MESAGPLNIKQTLDQKGLLERPIHIISANMHSVMNSLYAERALPVDAKKGAMHLYELLSDSSSDTQREKQHNWPTNKG